VGTIPPFPRLAEPKARQGFLSDETYDRLAQECSREGLWLRGMFAVGCNFGWRKSEVLNLQVRQVDFSAGTIRLDRGTTKNDDGRVVRMPNEVHQLLSACVAGKGPLDFVLTRDDGQRISDFRLAWSNACERAGCPSLLFHDLRRTGARNLRRLGVSEGVVMKIGGWRTREIFERYNIIDEADLADAARRLDEKRARTAMETDKKTDTRTENAEPRLQ
jgi:integrase